MPTLLQSPLFCANLANNDYINGVRSLFLIDNSAGDTTTGLTWTPGTPSAQFQAFYDFGPSPPTITSYSITFACNPTVGGMFAPNMTLWGGNSLPAATTIIGNTPTTGFNTVAGTVSTPRAYRFYQLSVGASASTGGATMSLELSDFRLFASGVQIFNYNWGVYTDSPTT